MSTESTTPLPERDDDATTSFEAPTTSFDRAETQATGFTDRADDAPVTAPRERLRVGTVVWGLVVVLAGAAVVAWGQGLRFDVQLAAIGVLAAAGALLVVSALTRSRRSA